MRIPYNQRFYHFRHIIAFKGALVFRFYYFGRISVSFLKVTLLFDNVRFWDSFNYTESCFARSDWLFLDNGFHFFHQTHFCALVYFCSERFNYIDFYSIEFFVYSFRYKIMYLASTVSLNRSSPRGKSCHKNYDRYGLGFKHLSTYGLGSLG